MTEPSDVLRFDRADYGAQGKEAPPCGMCKQPLGSEYWRWQRLVVCTGCRPKLDGQLAASQSSKTLTKAALQGAGVALALGVAYAVFVAVTKFQLALVTIGIAYVVARVVRKASGGMGGRRFQVLAVALTYVASTMGYAPGIVQGFKDSVAEDQHEVAKNAGPAAARQAEKPANDSANDLTPAAAGEEARPKPHAMLGALLYVMALFLGIMLAAPFLEMTTAPLGVIIVLIGLYEAWRLTRGVPTTLEGPYRIEAAPQGSPSS